MKLEEQKVEQARLQALLDKQEEEEMQRENNALKAGQMNRKRRDSISQLQKVESVASKLRAAI